MMNRTLISAALALALAGCNLAPEYQRPDEPIPREWPASAANIGQGKSLAETGWQDFFADARLKQVVDLALRNNRDLRVAVLNIEKARAQHQISGAAQFPAINATGAENAQRQADVLSTGGDGEISRQYSLGVGFSGYELDFFGRVRNLKDQALEQFLATEDARRSVHISLVAEVANTWLTLAADQERLQLARDTLASQQSSLALTQHSFDVGVSTMLDLNLARMPVESAKVDLARYAAAVAQDRNALNLLVGSQTPEDLLPTALTDVTTALTDIPAGVPSETLLQRPDVAQAERTLRAANANIGAARAAFYPRITLTASGGVASDKLSELFESGAGTWTFMPQIVLPIFNAGSNQANLDSARVDKDIRIAQYEKAIQVAFREASDTLAVRATVGDQLGAQQALVDTAEESSRLSDLRYRSGIDSYLPVLDSQRSHYTAQQNLITVRQARQSNSVSLYKVFGGGWLEKTVN